MFQFVYWLRAIAAVMITNSHYADIWPISAMAFGGHFGNCIYFFLSGFCLYNIQESFPRWYAKRIIRIYPALWIVAAINLLTGFWGADGIMAYVHCLFYPTWYHFHYIHHAAVSCVLCGPDDTEAGKDRYALVPAGGVSGVFGGLHFCMR